MADHPTSGFPNPKLGRIKNLLSGRLGPGSRYFEELAKFAVDYTFWKEDFLGLTAAEAVGASKVWQYEETAAGPVDVVKVTPTFLLQSYVELDYGVTDNSNMALVTVPMFCAKAQPFFETRFQLNQTLANGTAEMTIGLVTALPGNAGDILGDIDTPTFAGGVTDAAVFGVDTDETLKTVACQTIGTSTAVGKTTVAGAAPFTQPTINVDVSYRVELRDSATNADVSQAFFFINDLLVVQRVGPDAEKVLAAIFLWGNRGTNSKKASIDYLTIGSLKSGAPW